MSFDNLSQISLNRDGRHTTNHNNNIGGGGGGDKSINNSPTKSFNKQQASAQNNYQANVNSVDIMKMEKVLTLVLNLFKAKKVFKAFISLLTDLKSTVNCSIVTLFLFDSKISDHKIKDFVFMQKMMIDGRWVDRIGVNEKDVSEPAFKKIEEVTKIIRT